MTNEQIQALKAAAIAVGRDGRTDDEWFHYLQCVHYKFILSLLAERDADKALISEQAKRIAELREWNAGLAQESLDHQQRIAELEARTLTVKLPAVMRLYGSGVSFNAYGQSGIQNALYEACAAAGITLVVEE